MDAGEREQSPHARGQRRRVAAAPCENETGFRVLFAHAPFAVALADRRRRLLAYNPAYEALVGYRAAELQGRPFPTVTHPNDAPRDLALFRELMAGLRDHYHLAKRYLRKDGRVIRGHLTAFPVEGAPGASLLALGLVVDLAPWQQTEDALREMEAQYRALADLFAAGVPLIASPGPVILDIGATDRPADTATAPPGPAAPSRASPVAEPLTSRERQVLELSAHGYRDKEIAERLFIGPKTVETHARVALRKLEARTRIPGDLQGAPTRPTPAQSGGRQGYRPHAPPTPTPDAPIGLGVFPDNNDAETPGTPQ